MVTSILTLFCKPALNAPQFTIGIFALAAIGCMLLTRRPQSFRARCVMHPRTQPGISSRARLSRRLLRLWRLPSPCTPTIPAAYPTSFSTHPQHPTTSISSLLPSPRLRPAAAPFAVVTPVLAYPNSSFAASNTLICWPVDRLPNASAALLVSRRRSLSHTSLASIRPMARWP